MRRGYKSKHRQYIRYFIFGIILAALAFGSIGIRLARPDTSEPVQCEPFSTGICEPSRVENCQPFYHSIRPECNPDRMSKDYVRECHKGIPPCPLDAAVGTTEYERSNINPECNPDRMPKDYTRECWKGGPPCPLDAAYSKDNDTIRSKTHEE